MARYNIIPVFVPHLGCPNDCVFCNQNRISGTKKFEIIDAKKEINKYLEIYDGRDQIEIAFYGGSFTMIDKDIQDSLLSIAKDLKSKGKISRIRMSTRPDGIDIDTIERLKYYGVDTVELGVQSLSVDVLEASKRNHSPEDLYNSYKLLRDNGFIVGLQQMVGLPEDNIYKSILTGRKIAGLGPDFVRIYPTLVIEDTELADMYRSGNYTPLSLDEAVKISAVLKLMYDSYDIPVIRLGLQSSEDLQPGVSVVAGPHHDAIGELVMTEILTDVIISSGYSMDSGDTISAYPKYISQIAGQGGAGKQKLLQYFGIDKLRLNQNPKVDQNTIYIKDQKIDLKYEKEKLLEEWIDVFKEY